MKKGIRLDMYLSDNKISRSREKAKREIIAGWVKVDGETIRTPSKIISGSEDISVKRPGGIYVSRGGYKLQHAIEKYNISVKEKVIVDIGASTGGFTDCLLQNGARKVYAVDVGYGQLDYRLRNETRVEVREKTNVKNLKKEYFNEIIDFITIDLSFISIIKVFEVIKDIFSPVEGIILIKPQFEAMRNELKKGVVRKKEDHKKILMKVVSSLLENETSMKGLTHSPIKGPAGNIEFLFYFSTGFNKSNALSCEALTATIDHIVDISHLELNVNK